MLKVPIGTSVRECINAAGPVLDDYRIILGGPRITSYNVCYTKLLRTNRRHEFYSARTKSNEFALWVELDNKDVLQNKLQHLKQDLYEFSSSIEYAKSVEYLFAVAYYGEHGECFSDLYEKTTIAMRIKKENQIEGIT